MTHDAVCKFLDLSANHLPNHVFEDLNSYTGVVAHKLEYGWFLYVPENVDEHAMNCSDESEPIPPEVLAIQRFARSLDCDYVMLDRDALTIAELPTWEW